jgi:tripartite-type tricarboxylate transporter receptor subunit TctC
MSRSSFARAADVRMLHVPFFHAGAMLSAVAIGDVDFTTISINTASGLMASGKLRPIAVAAAPPGDAPGDSTIFEAGGRRSGAPWAALVAVAHRRPFRAAAARHRVVPTWRTCDRAPERRFRDHARHRRR